MLDEGLPAREPVRGTDSTQASAARLSTYLPQWRDGMSPQPRHGVSPPRPTVSGERCRQTHDRPSPGESACHRLRDSRRSVAPQEPVNGPRGAYRELVAPVSAVVVSESGALPVHVKQRFGNRIPACDPARTTGFAGNIAGSRKGKLIHSTVCLWIQHPPEDGKGCDFP